VQRRSLLVLAIALIGILTIGLIAGTVNSTTVSESEEGDVQESAGEGEKSQPLDDSWGFWNPPGFLAVLYQPLLVLGIVGGIAYAAKARRPLLAVVLAGAVLLYLVFALNAEPDLAFSQQNNATAPVDNDTSGGGSGSESTEESPTSILWAVAPLLAVLLLVVGLAFASSSSEDEETSQAVPAEPESDTDAEEIANIAGRTATRIEESEKDTLENEVYQAWREMTGLLPVATPETTTPREFVDASTNAGIARSDAEELTELFEDVRYGGYTATEEMEARATNVLRSIEDTYETGSSAE